MESILPVSIVSLIYEFVGIKEQWKTRFSNDILMNINKGYRLVGMICNEHFHEPCDCVDRYPCANCYSYNYDNGICMHDKFDMISYDDIKPHHSDFIRNPYIPYEHWIYFQSKYNNYKRNISWFIMNCDPQFTYSETIIPILRQLKTV